ncbi:MAG: hypothetical protein ACD_48C00671G0001, partial [uncultured bacterium]
MMRFREYLRKSFVVSLISVCILVPTQVFCVSPKTVNYFLKWQLTSEEVNVLANWNMLILDMEQQVKNPELLKQFRQKNPDIIILAYITPQEILKNASSVDSTMRRKLASNINESMYLYDTNGNKLSYWPGTYLLNVTNVSVRNTISDFVAQDILSSGLWDGVFYDNAWGSLDWAIPGGNVDFDRNGTNDLLGSGNAVWTEATKQLYKETRKKIGKETIMVGNGWTDMYADVLDGMMI